MSEEEEKTDKQKDNRELKSLADRPWLFQKGQSGNPKGRPKGVTLKEYCRNFLSKQTEEERAEFLAGLNKETIWKMAEGNPKDETDITSGGDKISIELKGKAKKAINNYLDDDKGNTTKRQPTDDQGFIPVQSDEHSTGGIA
ncbi:hypothetical protein GQ568_03355 [Patescibacteria group bacterium]|nr:hypothetical protein [Patescibacteria group bacterium]